MTDDSETLADGDELLHRQVHPTFVDNGRVGSQAFRPTPKDEGQLSVSRGALSTAEEAYVLYTERRGLSSVGVWSVPVAECTKLRLNVHSDPLTEPVEDPAHAFVDFRGTRPNATNKLSKRLAALARARGRQHPAEPAPAGD